MIIGYASISLNEDSLDFQHALLRSAFCTRVYADVLVGQLHNQPQLELMLQHVGAGDVVVTERIDRLARSVGDLLEFTVRLKAAGAGLRSLNEPMFDTTSPEGRPCLDVMNSVREFNSRLIAARVSAGRMAAVADGTCYGRPRALTSGQIEIALAEIADGRSVRDVAKVVGVHHSTLYRAIVWEIGGSPSKVLERRSKLDLSKRASRRHDLDEAERFPKR